MDYLAVAIGGCVGACLRFVLSEWIGTARGFPVATLFINCIGSFILAWLYTITQGRIRIHPHARLGLGTGLIGAFTTFSTFGVETWQLVRVQAYGMALAYVLTTMFVGLAMAFMGYSIAARQSRLQL